MSFYVYETQHKAPKKKVEPEYAMYRGQDLLYFGTLNHIAKEHGVKPETIQFYSTPTYQRRRANSKKGNFITVIKLEDDEE